MLMGEGFSMSAMLGGNKNTKTSTRATEATNPNEPDMEYFEEGQIFLLKNGNFIYIYSVDPASKIRKNYDQRSVGYMVVTKYSKSELSASSYATVVRTNSNFSLIVNADKRSSEKMNTIYDMIGSYIGKVGTSKRKQISKMLGRQIND